MLLALLKDEDATKPSSARKDKSLCISSWRKLMKISFLLFLLFHYDSNLKIRLTKTTQHYSCDSTEPNLWINFASWRNHRMKSRGLKFADSTEPCTSTRLDEPRKKPSPELFASSDQMSLSLTTRALVKNSAVCCLFNWKKNLDILWFVPFLQIKISFMIFCLGSG